jgi:CheY-like chemotaxis protein
MPKKILVIDNDPDFVEALVSVLEANGYATLSATDGNTGVMKAKADRPDLILLDVMMRYVSEGLDIAVKLRDESVTAAIPVVLITGIRKADFLAASFRPGEEWSNLKGTMEKPIKPEELIKMVKGIIG